jgi:DNA repair exonuclease SbcCD ATPase subunit
MKIISFRAENIKRLSLVEVRPDGNVVQITGRNGQGKTSILDSVFWALAGGDTIQGEPIRRGADKATIKLDLGEIIVTRKFARAKEDGFTTALTVEAADGSRFPSPQRMLDDMLGALSFDPLAFSRMKPREQYDTLRLFVPGVDFDAMEKQNKSDYEKRTDENRKAKELRAQAAGINVDEIVDKVDVSALVTELEEAGQRNAKLNERRMRREQAQKDIEKWHDQVEAIDREVAGLDRRIHDLQIERKDTLEMAEELEKRLAEAAPLPAPVDTAALTRAIADAQAQNEAARAYEQKAEMIQKARQHEAQSEALSEAMKAREQHKQAAIAAAKMPVPGLSLGDGEVILNGVPFEQASDAEKLKVSVAIAIASNPKIKVIRVRDGSLLDDDSFATLAKMADEAAAQIWVETIRAVGKPTIIMEDGRAQ